MSIRRKLTIIMTTLIVISIITTGIFTYVNSSNIIVSQTKKSALDLVSAENHIISNLIENEKCRCCGKQMRNSYEIMKDTEDKYNDQDNW